MGKKKLTEKQKKEIIAQKKKKEKEDKQILAALSKQNKQVDSSVYLSQFSSVKTINKNRQQEHKKIQENRAQKKKDRKDTQDGDEFIEEEYNQNNDDDEINEKTKKKVRLQEEEDQQKGFNIFQQSNFVNEEFKQADIDSSLMSKQKTKREEQIELEIAAKKAFPQLSFDRFEGVKTSKRIEEENDNQILDQIMGNDQKKSNEKEEIVVESDKEEVFDEQLKQIVKGYKKQNINVERTELIEEQRKKLPVYFREQEIVEAVNNNLITLVCGATGSGKSTQIPQFLYEAGYGNENGQNPGIIGVTQPRRLAAVSLAKRVADELNCELGQEVIYQVRHESSNFDTDKSKVKFMTDGILMNEMATDFFLTKYSVIIVDEAHERKINTDLLLGLLSRLVNIRLKLAMEKKDKYFPLRVIIMSATLRVEDFTKNKRLLPKEINVINIQSRTFPVNIYFNKRTNSNYVEEAVKKCANIHTKLPPGDVLIFLTGEREIKEFMILLQSELEKQKRNHDSVKNKQDMIKNEDFALSDSEDEDDEEKEGEDKEQKKKDKEATKIISHNPLESEFAGQDKDLSEEEQKKRNQERDQKGMKRKDLDFQNFVILPLYSKLSMEEQDKIFKAVPNQRMFVVSTNVAETSLTIPNIKYVVDTGKEKKKIYTSKLSISKHVVSWTSNASANQRTGRAGRTCPGYCYRLYAPSVFGNIMEKYSEPEILNTPLENVILHLKNIGIKDVLNFPFPTQPDLRSLNYALQNLINIDALQMPLDILEKEAIEEEDSKNVPQFINRQDENAKEDRTIITELGKVLSYIPLNPKFSKIILQGRQAGIIEYTLLIVSFLSVEEIFNKEQFQVKVDFDKNSNNNNIIEEEEGDEDNKRIQIKNNLSLLKEIKDKQKQLMDAKHEEISNFKSSFNDYYMGKSDIFVGMNVLGKFVSHIQKFDKFKMDQEIHSFAREKGLLTKSLKEVYLTLNQLLEILDNLIKEKKNEEQDLDNDINNNEQINSKTRSSIKGFFENYKTPNQSELDILSEMVIACFVNKIARKINYLDENQIKKVAYESCEINEKVWINPKSFLASQKPDFVCYTEITESKKKFINNITCIDSMQLLYKYDFYKMRGNRNVEFLPEPRPMYNEKIDQMQSRIQYSFGPKQWSLPPFWGAFQEENQAKYCNVARCLLDGEIFSFFKVIKKFYKINVLSIKPSNVSPAVQGVVNQLKNNEIDNKEKLTKQWEKQPQFLLAQVLLWLKPEHEGKVKAKWPPTI